ncbi:MAG: Dabb family protein [Massilibacteroides sp.]|nr:Dabb family protein [Massilibacteroides sp.]
MKRRQFLTNAGTAAFTAVASTGLMSAALPAGLKKGEMLHTVIFDLKHPVDSSEANKFLNDGYAILTRIPGVHDFQVFRQVSPKNNFQYGFYMRFLNKEEFEAYTNHPDHNKFVVERWDKEVVCFQESDFVAF